MKIDVTKPDQAKLDELGVRDWPICCFPGQINASMHHHASVGEVATKMESSIQNDQTAHRTNKNCN